MSIARASSWDRTSYQGGSYPALFGMPTNNRISVPGKNINRSSQHNLRTIKNPALRNLGVRNQHCCAPALKSNAQTAQFSAWSGVIFTQVVIKRTLQNEKSLPCVFWHHFKSKHLISSSELDIRHLKGLTLFYLIHLVTALSQPNLIQPLFQAARFEA
jgi:hypothetical protein